MTRLLLINPNISDSVSALIRAEAAAQRAPGTEVEVLTAPFGVAYIETRFEALIGAYAAAQLAAEHHARFDAVVVAAFGDPGLDGAARGAARAPSPGLTEAALASACLLGQRFSIVAISQRIRAWYRETVQAYGLADRLASIRALDEPLADIGRVQDDQGERLVALAERCVDEDGADVIVLAGAPLAGLARSLRGRLPVPVVDGVSSAVRHAQSAGRAAARPRARGQLRAAAAQAQPRAAAQHRGAAAPPVIHTFVPHQDNAGTMMKRRHFLHAAGAAVASLAAPGLFAQALPATPIRLVVGFPPGGGADALARVVAQKLGTLWNQQVVVDNKAGASGTLAADYMLTQPADGSVLLLSNINSHALAPAVRSNCATTPSATSCRWCCSVSRPTC